MATAKRNAKTKAATKSKKAAPKKTAAPTKKAATKKAATKKAAPEKKAAPTQKRAVASLVATTTTESAPPTTRAPETLGTIRCPSGTLAIFDVGLVGYLAREALEPAIVKVEVPADRPLEVTGTRVGRGRLADCWDHVAVLLSDGEVHTSRKLGKAGVDFARLVLMDHAALDAWQHEDSLDGRADVVFWGRDEAALARALGASRTKDGHGWMNLPVADAEARALEADRKKAANKWLLKIDYRPHSHHYLALATARANPRGAGELDLAGSRLLLFFTSWGDGVFPIFLDLDAQERPVRVRVQLATPASFAAMSAVNQR